MVTATRFRALCNQLGDDIEARPHFDRTAFRTPARIFTTLGPKGREANVRLSPEVQDMVVGSRPDVFTKLNGGWGAMGWTGMNLETVDEATCAEILREAHALADTPATKKAKPKKSANKEKKKKKKAVKKRRP